MLYCTVILYKVPKLKTLRDTTDYMTNDYVLWELPEGILNKDSREDVTCYDFAELLSSTISKEDS